MKDYEDWRVTPQIPKVGECSRGLAIPVYWAIPV